MRTDVVKSIHISQLRAGPPEGGLCGYAAAQGLPIYKNF